MNPEMKRTIKMPSKKNNGANVEISFINSGIIMASG
jgi:hypothetical protein